MKQFISIAVLVAAVLGGPSSASAATKRFAIVIGNNQAPADAPKGYGTLRYADDDAVRWSQLLRRANAEVTLLTVLDSDTQRRYPKEAARSGQPRLRNLLSAVARVRRSILVARARGDTTIVYLTYSGHGAHDKAGHAYLSLMGGQLTQKALYDQVVAPLGADYVHLIVDACHAGGVVGIRSPGGEVSSASVRLSPADIARSTTSDSLRRFPHVGVIVATSADQETHEWSRLESGIFTHEVLSAVSGAADVNGDGAIEYTEIQAYAAAANRGLANPRAVPRALARAPRQRRNLPFLRLSALGNTAFLVGTTRSLKRFHVELGSGQRLLDAHLTPRLQARLAIPAGQTAWLVTKKHQARLGSLQPGQVVAIDGLRMVKRTRRPRGAVDAALRTGLFATPYGRSYYRGFVDSGGLVGVRFDVAPMRLPGRSRGAFVAPRVDTPRYDRVPRRKRQLAGLSVGLGAVSVAAGVLALYARRDSTSNVQLDAADARRRYRTYGWISLTLGAAAAAAGIVSWRSSGKVKVDVSTPRTGGRAASLVVTAPF